MAERTWKDRAVSIGEGVTANGLFWGLLNVAGVNLSPVEWITAASGVAFVTLVTMDILRSRAARKKLEAPKIEAGSPPINLPIPLVAVAVAGLIATGLVGYLLGKRNTKPPDVKQ